MFPGAAPAFAVLCALAAPWRLASAQPGAAWPALPEATATRHGEVSTVGQALRGASAARPAALPLDRRRLQGVNFAFDGGETFTSAADVVVGQLVIEGENRVQDITTLRAPMKEALEAVTQCLVKIDQIDREDLDEGTHTRMQRLIIDYQLLCLQRKVNATATAQNNDLVLETVLFPIFETYCCSGGTWNPSDWEIAAPSFAKVEERTVVYPADFDLDGGWRATTTAAAAAGSTTTAAAQFGPYLPSTTITTTLLSGTHDPPCAGCSLVRVVGFNPADGNFVFTFDHAIVLATWANDPNATLYTIDDVGNRAYRASYLVLAPDAQVIDGMHLLMDFKGHLEPNVQYTITLSRGAVKDSIGKEFIGWQSEEWKHSVYGPADTGDSSQVSRVGGGTVDTGMFGGVSDTMNEKSVAGLPNWVWLVFCGGVILLAILTLALVRFLGAGETQEAEAKKGFFRRSTSRLGKGAGSLKESRVNPVAAEEPSMEERTWKVWGSDDAEHVAVPPASIEGEDPQDDRRFEQVHPEGRRSPIQMAATNSSPVRRSPRPSPRPSAATSPIERCSPGQAEPVNRRGRSPSPSPGLRSTGSRSPDPAARQAPNPTNLVCTASRGMSRSPRPSPRPVAERERRPSNPSCRPSAEDRRPSVVIARAASPQPAGRARAGSPAPAGAARVGSCSPRRDQREPPRCS